MVFTTSWRSSVGVVHLRAHEPEDELMVGFVEAGRVDDIRGLDGVDEIGDGDAGGLQAREFGTMWNSGTWPPCTVTVLTPSTRLSGGFRS